MNGDPFFDVDGPAYRPGAPVPIRHALGDGDDADLVRRLHSTNDAAVWATEFLKVVEAGATVDFGLMVGWLANAMVTATDFERRRTLGVPSCLLADELAIPMLQVVASLGRTETTGTGLLAATEQSDVLREPAVLPTLAVGASQLSSPDVLGLSDPLQMVDLDAACVVAQVVNLEVGWKVPTDDLPGDVMGATDATVDEDFPVAVGVTSPEPDGTPILLLLHLGPEVADLLRCQIGEGLRVCHLSETTWFANAMAAEGFARDRG